MITCALSIKQRWLVRALYRGGLVGAAALWLCTKCLPFKWLFRVETHAL